MTTAQKTSVHFRKPLTSGSRSARLDVNISRGRLRSLRVLPPKLPSVGCEVFVMCSESDIGWSLKSLRARFV